MNNDEGRQFCRMVLAQKPGVVAERTRRSPLRHDESGRSDRYFVTSSSPVHLLIFGVKARNACPCTLAGSVASVFID